MVAVLVTLLLTFVRLEITGTLIIRHFVDSAVAGKPIALLMRTASAFVVVALLTQGGGIAEAYVAECLGWVTTNRMRRDLMQHCLSLDMAFHKSSKPGEMIVRLDTDVAELSNFFSRMFLNVGASLMLPVGVLIVMSAIDWRVGLLVSVLAVILPLQPLAVS